MIEETIMPGISLVNKEIRQRFISTEEGFAFDSLVNQINNANNAPIYIGALGTTGIRRPNHQHDIQKFLRLVQNSTSYSVLKKEIIKQKLILFYPIFSTLSDELQNTLASTRYSLSLFTQPLNKEARENWLIDFIKDETPEIIEILNRCHLDIIKHELTQCYTYYESLTEEEQTLLAEKPYSNIFLIYPPQLAKPLWLTAWAADNSEDARYVKENEQKDQIKSRVRRFYPHYEYLNDDERAVLIQKNYSAELLIKEDWLSAFANDDADDLLLIKEKEALRPIKDKIKTYYPGYIYLDQNQRHQLASTWYSKQCLSSKMNKHDWLRALANDQQDFIVKIKQTIADEYQYHIGFLFKNAQSNWQTIISDMYASDTSPQEKIQFLQKRLNQDWAYENPLWESISYNIETSLNYFLHHPSEAAKKYVDDIANAHAFYRFFGMSSDNVVFGLQYEPGSLVAAPIANLLDLYNYHKNRKILAETLNIWQALRIPLNLFFDEYLEIGRFEKNSLNICLRAFIPFLVMAFFLTLGYSLVLPLATHVFLEYLLFIPSLYLSIAAASLYLHIRNETYVQIIDWWYGGYLNSPLFLANERLEMAFCNEDTSENNVSLADCVAQFYTQKFEECEKVEEAFSKCKSHMNSNDLKLYQQYSRLKFELYLEWYDIHERTNVPIDKIPKIIHDRLKNEQADLIKQIRSNNNDYVSKYSNQFMTFFNDDRHKALRDKCALRNKRFVELESLTLKIDKQIQYWENHSDACNMMPV